MADRKRAPRGTLARETVVEAAIEEFRSAQTIQDLTVANVAARLGVRPMSLYTHIRNKDDLLRSVAGELFLPLGADQIANRDQLITLYRRYFALLIEYPALVQVVSTRWSMVTEMYPELMQPRSRGAFLADEGIDESVALLLFSALSRYALGCAALYHTRPTVLQVLGTGAEADASSDDKRSQQDVFEFGLQTLVSAVLDKVAT